jgi:hypothetical protein
MRDWPPQDIEVVRAMTPAKLFGLTKASYTRKETAREHSCGLTLVDEMVADGRLKSVKLGKAHSAKRLILGVSIAEVLMSGAAQPIQSESATAA